MARLAVQLVGGFIGSQIGVGFGIGAFVGGIIGNLLFPPKGTTTIGPRLQDLSVNASTYGRPIPFGFGAMLYNGNIIWSPGLIEHRKEETTGGGLLGKGGAPSQTAVSFTYTASYAILFSEGPISAYSRIWGDTKLLRDPFLRQAADGTIEGDLDVFGKFDSNMTFYLGTETQLPDPTMEAEEGIGNISAHRGLAYIMFTDLPLEDFGNRIPNTRAEIFTNSSNVFPLREHTELTTVTNTRWSMLNFRRTRVFAWDIISGAMHIAELNIKDLSVIKSTVIPAPGSPLFFASTSLYFRWAFDVFDNFYWPVRDSNFGGIGFRRFLKVNLDSFSWEIGADSGITNANSNYHCGNYIDGQGIARTRALYGVRLNGDNLLIWKRFPDLMGGLPNPRGIDIDQSIPDPLGTQITEIKDADFVAFLNNECVVDEDGYGWIFQAAGNAGKYSQAVVMQIDEFGVRFTKTGWVTGAVFPSDDGAMSHKGFAFDITTNSAVILSNLIGSDKMFLVRFNFDTKTIDASIDGTNPDIGDLPGTINTYFDRRRCEGITGAWIDHDNRFLENPNIWFVIDEEAADGEKLIHEIDVSTFTLAARGPDEAGGYQTVNWEPTGHQLWGAWYNQVNHSIVWLSSSDVPGGCGSPVPDTRSHFLDRVGITPGDVVNIRTIVDDILDRVGLLSGDRDTIALDREAAADPAFPEFKDVIGFAVDKQQTARSVLELLSKAFVFHLVETGWLLKALWRGDVIVSPDIVPIDDLGSHNFSAQRPPQITETRQQDAELPSRVTVTYIDQDREYQDNTQHAKRADELVTFTELVDVNFPIVINHSQAKLMAFIALYTSIVGRRTFEFTLPPKYIRYDPGDFLSIPVGGVQERVVIDSTDLGGSGLIKMTATLDDPEVFQPPFGDIANIGTQALLPKKSTVLDQSGLTGSVLYLLDIPLLRDSDEGTGIYLGAAGADEWPGAIVFKSPDGFDFTDFTSFVSSQNSFSGSATTVLADGPTTIFDNGNSVTVFLINSEHVLVSITEDQVLAGGNPALLGSEIIQYRDVVDNGDGTWTLSGLLRGRKGTEQHAASHVAGERFIFLDKATTRRILENESDINLLRFYKAVTIGATLDDSGAIGFTNTSVGQKPYSVVHVDITRDGSDNIIITWIRRTRIDGQWRDFVDVSLGETTESYEVDIVGASPPRTIAVTAQTATYTIGDQTTDFGGAKDPVDIEIFQMSSLIGRGFKTEFTG